MSVATIRDLMTDPDLLGGTFGGESWSGWRALLSAFYGLPLSDPELAHFRALTGREKPPEGAFTELWLVIGRRGGKSIASAVIAIYEALFRDHAKHLAPGEVATVLCLAGDQKQARAAFRYIRGLLDSSPILSGQIVAETKESVDFANRARLEIRPASFRSVRSYTLAACIADEIAFWNTDEGANPDGEIISALRPALITLGGRLAAISSPYAKRGELWRHYRQFFGVDDPRILVAQGASRRLNPNIPERVIDDALERDEASARSEYLAEFRADIEEFISEPFIRSMTRASPETLPPLPYRIGRRPPRYTAFCDPAGGGADGFALSIAHADRATNMVVVDLIVERFERSPAETVAEFARILKNYDLRTVVGDRYAGAWVSDEFARHKIKYLFADRDKSALYVDFLAAANSGRVELPPNEKLVQQFTRLERRTARGGRDRIDHPPRGHDDLANVAAGAVVYAASARSECVIYTGIGSAM